MAEKKKSPGLVILGKSSNWYEARTRRQLLAKERDHSPFLEKQIDEIVIPTLEKQGRKLADEPSPLAISGTIPGATQGQGFSAQLEAKDGYGGYSFAITGGTLPEGVGFDNRGRFYGVPAFAGSYSVTATVTDSLGQTASMGVSISVAKAEEIPEETVAFNPGARFDDPPAEIADTANATGSNGATDTGQGATPAGSSEASVPSIGKTIVEPSSASDSTETAQPETGEKPKSKIR